MYIYKHVLDLAYPQNGELLLARAPVNAGVMLLKPSVDVLNGIIDEICGPNPRKLPAYNSPDADYLTHWVPHMTTPMQGF